MSSGLKTLSRLREAAPVRVPGIPSGGSRGGACGSGPGCSGWRRGLLGSGPAPGRGDSGLAEGRGSRRGISPSEPEAPPYVPEALRWGRRPPPGAPKLLAAPPRPSSRPRPDCRGVVGTATRPEAAVRRPRCLLRSVSAAPAASRLS